MLTAKLNIELKEKSLDELLKNVPVTNGCKYKETYAIEGNVKSMTPLVMKKKHLSSPIIILMIFLQHVVMYGTTFGKGKFIKFNSEYSLKFCFN